jgi:hypothetical protein
MFCRTSCRRQLALFFLTWSSFVTHSASTAHAQHPVTPRSSVGALEFIVIAPEQFRKSLAAYIAFRQDSLATEFLSLDEILASSKGSDDAEKVKHYLYDQWKSRGLRYALLVGDADLFPVRYMVLDRITEPAFDYAFYPSDLYYGDLAKPDGSFDDWNASHDGFHAGYLGEVRGEKNKDDPINFDRIDYLPEVAVGRWPVNTCEEVALVAEKTISYERSLAKRAANQVSSRAAFIAVGGWVDCRDQLTNIAELLNKHWSTERLFYQDRDVQQTPPFSAASVVALLNDGVDLVVHAGHGHPDGWDQSLSIHDLPKINNHDRLPIIISAGCSTAYFATLPPYEGYTDQEGRAHLGTNAGEVFTQPPPPPDCYQSGEFNRTGLGEQLLRKDANGAIAYFGCNTGSQPCGLSLVEGVGDALARTDCPRLGDSWKHAIRYYFEQQKLAELEPNADWYPPSIFFQGMKFMLFGDPSLTLPAR